MIFCSYYLVLFLLAVFLEASLSTRGERSCAADRFGDGIGKALLARRPPPATSVLDDLVQPPSRVYVQVDDLGPRGAILSPASPVTRSPKRIPWR